MKYFDFSKLRWNDPYSYIAVLCIIVLLPFISLVIIFESFFTKPTFWKVNLLGIFIVSILGISIWQAGLYTANQVPKESKHPIWTWTDLTPYAGGSITYDNPQKLSSLLQKCPQGFECVVDGNLLRYKSKNTVSWPATFLEAEKIWPRIVENYETITLSSYDNKTEQTRKISISYPYVQNVFFYDGNDPVQFTPMQGDFYEVRMKNSNSCWIAEIPFFTNEEPKIRACIDGK